MQHPCAAGTYNPDNQTDAVDDCIDCTPGFYCDREGLSEVSGPCNAGYFCTGGATLAVETVNGGMCRDGFYCPEGISNQACGTLNCLNPSNTAILAKRSKMRSSL